MEIWKDVVGHESYEVSSGGRIRNRKTGKIRKCEPNKAGYVYVSFGDSRKGLEKVTDVVARAFLGEKPKGYVCDHIDRDRANNRVSNLRYVTQGVNVRNCQRWEDAVHVYNASSTPRLKKIWRVYFGENGKRRMYGSYQTYEEACEVARRIKRSIKKSLGLRD